MRPSSALIVHRRLKAAVAELARAEKNAVTLFAEVLRRKLYRDLGYGSIHLYAQAELSFSASKTSQFVRLAESLESLPKLKEEVNAGSLPWTKAREVAKVATADTEAAWIGVAKSSSRRKLEASIGEARAEATAAKRSDRTQTALPRQRRVSLPPAPMPASVTLRFTPEQLAQFEALMEAVQKKGARGSREAVLLAGLEMAVSGDASTHAAARSPYQVTVTLCPSCERASLPTSRGTETLDTASTAAILSDCDRIDREHRKRSAIPPRVRRRVLERDGHRCRAPGCTNTRFLEIDHVLPVEAGGTNDPANLRVLCSACHRARHRRDALYPGKRDGGLARTGSPRRFGAR